MFRWLKNSNMVNNDYFVSNSIDCGWTKALKIEMHALPMGKIKKILLQYTWGSN
jgi:hypothetical protein